MITEKELREAFNKGYELGKRQINEGVENSIIVYRTGDFPINTHIRESGIFFTDSLAYYSQSLSYCADINTVKKYRLNLNYKV